MIVISNFSKFTKITEKLTNDDVMIFETFSDWKCLFITSFRLPAFNG